MYPIGFIAPRNTMLQNSAVIAQPPSREIPSLYQFDSGATIYMDEAARSTLVLGSTGSGKTHSVLLPMLENLMKAGYGGVVIDVKGNLREPLLALAESCGRKKDVVEFGSSPTASPTNLLEGISAGERRQMFMDMCSKNMCNDANISWLLKGGRMAADVADVLDALHQHYYPQSRNSPFVPTLERVYTLLTDWKLAAAFWCLYLEVITEYDSASPMYTPYKNIASQKFHVCKWNASIEVFSESSDTFLSQVSWMTQGITSILASLQQSSNLLTKFSSADNSAVCMDYKHEIYDNNKIVLVHFSPSCGRAGEMLSAISKNRFYQALYAHGLQLPQDRYTFFLGDEFQGIINVNTPEGNDVDLFSVSREFRNINIIATQSLASLYSKAQNAACVHSLIANCLNIISLQATDFNTMEWMEKVFPPQVVKDGLQAGECALRRFDQQTRTTLVERSSVNEAFEQTREHIASAAISQKSEQESLSEQKTEEAFPFDLSRALCRAVERVGNAGRHCRAVVDIWLRKEEGQPMFSFPCATAQNKKERTRHA